MLATTDGNVKDKLRAYIEDMQKKAVEAGK
jgi:hypothetical protein